MREILLTHPEMESERYSFNKLANKSQHALTSALTRTLTGHRDKKTKKSVFTFKNWRVLGIYTFMD